MKFLGDKFYIEFKVERDFVGFLAKVLFKKRKKNETTGETPNELIL